MNAKRMLSILLTLCLMLSLLAPAASAVTAGEDAYVGAETQQNGEKTEVSGMDKYFVNGDRSQAQKTLWNTPGESTVLSTGKGQWTATESDKEYETTLNSQLPVGVQELKEAAEYYAEDEAVVAFIVLEDAALAEMGYKSISNVPEAAAQAMLETQDALISHIETSVLKGAALDVRYQFTYLTNAVTVSVPFGKLDEIAALDGVKTVFLAPVYDACTTEDVSAPLTASTSDMVGVDSVWKELGYTGAGMKIAVIDTGLDLDHPSFAAAPALTEDSMTVADIEAVYSRLNATQRISGVSAEDFWYSEKIPFIFNYIDKNLTADHSSDSQGYHGTHVAGIAAANATEGTDVVGMAPDAQLIVLKVFGQGGGAYTDDIVAALEDAMTLDCDVVNMSLGSTAGFTSTDPEIDAIYARIAYHDIIVSVSAGNEYTSALSNLSGTNMSPTAHPDNATVASPGTYVNTTVVASAENDLIITDYFTAGGKNFAYADAIGLYTTFSSLAGQEYAYVMVGGVGTVEDFAAVDVAGKIAVVSRGQINFSLKLYNAEQAGAVGLIIYNNEAGEIGLQMTDGNGNLSDGITGLTPAVSVTQAVGQYLAENENKVITVAAVPGPVESENGGQMSDFSSWGVSPDLRLLPDVTAIGGNVYSTVDEGQYGVMSGTSMSAPQLAGVAALVLQYLHEEHPELADAEMRVVADSLLMSTADPIIDSDSKVEASPRQQGAGVVNALEAITAEAYVTVAGSSKPKAELGDDVAREGVYSFTFDVHNFGTEEKTWDLRGVLLTEAPEEVDGVEYMSGEDMALSGSVSFSQNTVTVAPGGSARVNVTVTLSAEDKAFLDAHYANGIYVEGYVYLEGEDTIGLNLPFMGFYGDWTAAPMMDTAYWYEDAFWSEEGAEITGNQYYHVMWTSLNGVDWVLGMNPYTGDNEDYDPSHNVISNNGDNSVENIFEMYVSLMRNARTLTFTYRNAETGEVYDETSVEYVRKATYNGAYGQIIPFLYSWYLDESYDFTGADGEPLPNNTKLELVISADNDFAEHNQDPTGDSIVIPITIDVEDPALVGLSESSAMVESEKANTIDVTFSDNVAVAAVFLMNRSGSQIYGLYSPADFVEENGQYTLTMDVTGLGTELTMAICDYGTNEVYFDLTYESDDNMPVAPESGLYGYRVADDTYEDDHLYGWVAIDPETGALTELTDDYMETYALTAAEYAGGYVFGVEAASYDLVVMQPGLWNRTIVGNVGANTMDMAYDRDNNVMYLLQKADYQVSLATVDLVTAEVTEVFNYGYSGPMAIAWAEGRLYAIKQYSSYLYTINPETYALEEAVQVVADSAISPYYSQSITYSEADNCIYWAYNKASYYGNDAALYKFDLADLNNYTRVEFEHFVEFVGLTTLEDTAVSYQCPAEDCPSERFTDVNTQAWYHLAVDYVVENGYMNGMSDTTFAPTVEITRGQVMTILYRMYGAPEVTADHPFTDVKAGAYYENAIAWAYQNGLANGVTTTTFCPEQNITREQLVTFLYRYMNFMKVNTSATFDSLAAFEDADQVSAYAKDAMRWAVGAGVIKGMDATHLAPKGTALRAQFAQMLLNLFAGDLADNLFPVAALEELIISDESLLLAVGGGQALSVRQYPWTALKQEITWTSSDETVATVEQGLVTAVGVGYATITAAAGDVTATAEVHVVDPQGTVYAYNLYDTVEGTGHWMGIDLADMDDYSDLGACPVDFLAAEYNPVDGRIYGYDSNYLFHIYDPANGTDVASGSSLGNVQILDMAFDYSTGYLYASVIDNSMWTYGVYYVNPSNGSLVLVNYTMMPYMTLACSTEGLLYGIDAEGTLASIELTEDGYATETVIAALGLGSLSYTQSMCYDHNNDALIWAACVSGSAIIWIDPATGEYLVLGTPTGSYLFEYVGLYTIPETPVEVPYVAVESVTAAESVLLMKGSVKAAPVDILPLNASVRSLTWTSADQTVAAVDASGNIIGVGEGETTVTGTLVDGENSFTVTIGVKVMASADNIYGFVLTDMATYGGSMWAEIYDSDPANPSYLTATDYTMYAAEYYDGYIYAYGFDTYDWSSPMYFFVIDPATFEIIDFNAVPDCPSRIYDMTYDYSTGNLYVLASYADDSSDLYMAHMGDGSMTKIATLDQFYMGMAANAEGEIYLVSSSQTSMDPWTWETVTTNACLYTLDASTGETTLVGDTGLTNNMICSMAFDYDTGNLYWTNIFRLDYWSPVTSGLCVIDTETGAATDLGMIGAGGSQISGLMVIADNYPEEPDPVLSSVVIGNAPKMLSVGECTQLNAVVTHFRAEVTLSWASSNTAVATVDAEGVLTATGRGKTDVTLTAVDKNTGNVCTATVRVSVFTEEDTLLSYSPTMGGWVSVGRMDPTSVTLVCEDSNAVVAAAYVGEDIYGYDANGMLFKIAANATDYTRTEIGALSLELDESIGEAVEIRDLAYDAKNQRLLALVAHLGDNYGYMDELTGGCRLYTVDMSTGAAELLCSMSDLSSVRGMTVTGDGSVIVYSAFDDYFSLVDLSTGSATALISGQSMSLYGDTESTHALCYDEATGLIYWLFTSNGTYRTLYTVDLTSGKIEEVGKVGEVYYDYETWSYVADFFNTLLIK